MSQSNSAKMIFGLLLGIPVLVIGLSTALYFMAERGMIDLGTASLGTLIQPPLQITEMELTDESGEKADWFSNEKSKWSYMVIANRECSAACEKMLYLVRQTHTALGKKTPRVQRLLLSPGPELSPSLQAITADLNNRDHDSMRTMFATPEQLAAFKSRLPMEAQSDYSFVVMDPDGWVMMYYKADSLADEEINQLGKEVLKDMKRLLR